MDDVNKKDKMEKYLIIYRVMGFVNYNEFDNIEDLQSYIQKENIIKLKMYKVIPCEYEVKIIPKEVKVVTKDEAIIIHTNPEDT